MGLFGSFLQFVTLCTILLYNGPTMSLLLSKMSIILVTLYLCINVIVFRAAALYEMTYRTIALRVFAISVSIVSHTPSGLSVGSEGLPAGLVDLPASSKAQLAGSEAFSADSEVFPIGGFIALPTGSEFLLASVTVLPAGLESRPAGSKALQADTTALPASFKALPAGSQAQLAMRPS